MIARHGSRNSKWLIGVFIVAVSAFLLVMLQLQAGFEGKPSKGTNVATYGWPMLSLQVDDYSPSIIWFQPATVLNWTISFLFIASTGLVVYWLLRGGKQNFQFGLGGLMWLIFLIVMLLQLCEHETAIYEWANRQLFGDDLPRFYYEHWGSERPGWIYLLPVWIGFLATI